MLASPTWPSSYLHVNKDERTLFYVFLIKGHQSIFKCASFSCSCPLQWLSRGNHHFYALFCILPTSIPSSGKTQYMELKSRTGGLVWIWHGAISNWIPNPENSSEYNNNRPCHLVNACLKCGLTIRGHILFVRHQNAQFETWMRPAAQLSHGWVLNEYNKQCRSDESSNQQRYLHEKEASADMVRNWTHPDVTVFL